MAGWKKVIVSGSRAVLHDVTASAFAGDGSALTGITATSVDIDGLGALGGTGIDQADNFIFSDGGTEKKVTFSNLEDAIFGNVSGDIAIGAGGTAEIQADSVTRLEIASNVAGTGLEQHTDGSIRIAAAAAGDGLSGGAGSALALDLNELTDATMAVADDTIAFIDATDNSTKKEKFADIVGNMANSGLDASGGTLRVDVSDFMANGADNRVVTALTADTMNAEANMTFDGSELTVTGDIIATKHISGSLISGSFYGDGSNLTGVALDIDSLAALGGTGIDQADKLVFSDGGTEKSITFSNFEDAIFGNVSSEVTIAAGGAATVANNVIDESNLKASVAGTGLSGGNGSALAVDLSGESAVSIGAGTSVVTIGDDLTVAGDLRVNGTTTTVNTANLNIEDQLILVNSGSSSGDGGLIVQTGAAGKGAAIVYDDSESRWGLMEADSVLFNATSVDATGQDQKGQYIVSVSSSASDPNDGANPFNFGSVAKNRAGLMHVNYTSGDIFIYS